MSGGIHAWQGATVVGPAEVGMNLISGTESPSEMLLIAYAMEEGLRSFYERMELGTSDPDAAQLFGQMAAMDTSHKEKIYDLYKEHEGATSVQELEEKVIPKIMEGGMTTDEFLSANQSSLETVGDVLILAMMLEAQALDLYLRYSHRCENPATKQVLHELATEEKGHLTLLGNLKERF